MKLNIILSTLFVLMCMTFLCRSTAFGEPGDSLDRHQNQVTGQQEERLRELKKLGKDYKINPFVLEDEKKTLPEYPVPAEDDLCFEISRIILNGADHLSVDQQKYVVEKYIGQCLSMQDINKLIREVTNYYIELGYITTRVNLPSQNLSQGVLELSVTEAVVESIRFSTKTGKARRLITAFPDIKNDVLNLRDIEQGLDQMNRLRSSNAKLRLEPGTQTGSSVVVVDDYDSKKWGLSNSIDNSEADKLQMSWTATLDNLFELNDQVFISYLHEIQSFLGKDDDYSLFGNFSVPYGYWLFSFNLSRSLYKSEVKGLYTFVNSVDSKEFNLEAERLLYRDRQHKFYMSASLGYRERTNYMGDVYLYASSPRFNIVCLSGRHIWHIYPDSLVLAVSSRMGLPRNDCDSRFIKHEFDLTYSRPFSLFGISSVWDLAFHGQLTPYELPVNERLLVGSTNSVRGFKNGINGDSGFYLRNELQIMPNWPGFTNGRIVPFIGFDAGFIKDSNDIYELFGGSIGIRLNKGNTGLSLSFDKPFKSYRFTDDPSYLINCMLRFTF